MDWVLFFVIVFFSFMMQGITGFAGTILAMPLCIEIMSYEVAKPILNIVGIFAGLYIVITDYKYIDFKQIRKIIAFMVIGTIIGLFIYRYKLINMDILYFAFICFVGYVGIKGLFFPNIKKKKNNNFLSVIVITFAGIINNIFNTGGPILVGYASNAMEDKRVFRATLAMVWVISNSTIVVTDVINNLITRQTLIMSLIGIPILILATFIGSKIYHHIKPAHFTKITYILLIAIAAFILIF